MKNGQYHNALRFSTKIDAIGKPMCRNTTYVVVNDGAKFRPLDCQGNTSLDLGNEPGAQARAVTIIPSCRFNKFRTGCTMKRDRWIFI